MVERVCLTDEHVPVISAISGFTATLSTGKQAESRESQNHAKFVILVFWTPVNSKCFDSRIAQFQNVQLSSLSKSKIEKILHLLRVWGDDVIIYSQEDLKRTRTNNHSEQNDVRVRVRNLR